MINYVKFIKQYISVCKIIHYIPYKRMTVLASIFFEKQYNYGIVISISLRFWLLTLDNLKNTI